MKNLKKFIKTIIKVLTTPVNDLVYEEMEEIGTYCKPFGEDIENLTDEQRRTINAVFKEISHYYFNLQTSYYHPYPNMFKVMKKKY